jgi:hypothetical protein
MRLLLDECVPRPLKRGIAGHDVKHVTEMGWSGKENGELLALMVAEPGKGVCLEAVVAVVVVGGDETWVDDLAWAQEPRRDGAADRAGQGGRGAPAWEGDHVRAHPSSDGLTRYDVRRYIGQRASCMTPMRVCMTPMQACIGLGSIRIPRCELA